MKGDEIEKLNKYFHIIYLSFCVYILQNTLYIGNTHRESNLNFLFLLCLVFVCLSFFPYYYSNNQYV